MKKQTQRMTGLFLVPIAAFLIFAAPGISSENKGRKEMTLYGGKSGTVDFNHHLHQTLINDCQVCHKDFPQEKGALEAAQKTGSLKKKQVMNDTCLNCHREKKKAGEKTGPVSCKACHKK